MLLSPFIFWNNRKQSIKNILDKENANAQSKALNMIMKTVLGNEIAYMLVDKNPSIKNEKH